MNIKLNMFKSQNKNNKKAQSALEFVLLVSFMLVVFAVFFLAIQTKMLDVTASKDIIYLNEVNNIVLNEVFLAQNSYSDYHHEFFLPTNILGKGYTINLTDETEIISNYDKIQRVDFLKTNVKGNLFFGSNNIHNIDGKIDFLNGTVYYNESYKGIFININPELCYFAQTEINILEGENYCYTLNSYHPDYVSWCQDYFGLCLS